MKSSPERLAYAAAYYLVHKAGISAYKAAWYLEHKEERLAHDAAYRNEHRAEMAAYHAAYSAKHSPEFHKQLQSVREASGCKDCGTHEGRLIHHHVDPSTKRYCISAMGGRTKESIADEVAKCVVLCCTCHSERHKTLKYA